MNLEGKRVYGPARYAQPRFGSGLTCTRLLLPADTLRPSTLPVQNMPLPPLLAVAGGPNLPWNYQPPQQQAQPAPQQQTHASKKETDGLAVIFKRWAFDAC